MKIKQFLGIKWVESTPYMLMFNSSNNMFEYEKCEGIIQLKKLNEKRCKGYYDLEKKQLIKCENYNNLTESTYSQCLECKNKSGFDLCLGCKGLICRTRSLKAKRFCEQEHYVYLAYFAPNKLKVGTTVGYRKYERLLEQGAIFSIFLAKVPCGKQARVIENEISKFQITTLVNTVYKINNFIIDKSEIEIKKILMEKYLYLKNNINYECKKYFIQPEFNSFSKISDEIRKHLTEINVELTLFGEIHNLKHIDYEKVIQPEIVSGYIKAVVGSLLLLENNNEYSLVNMKYLEGWIVDLLIDHEL